MGLSRAGVNDVGLAAKCLAEAFEFDPLMSFFFPGDKAGRQRLTAEMFRILLAARVRLGMPVFVARKNGGIVGVAMGYDTRSVEWPKDIARSWTAFERKRPAMEQQFSTFEAVSAKFRPARPHYYLGVLGVRPGEQGTGVGVGLTLAFVEAAASDPQAEAVYLETANPTNLDFYRRCGFEMVGKGPLDDATTLYCLLHARSHRL